MNQEPGIEQQIDLPKPVVDSANTAENSQMIVDNAHEKSSAQAIEMAVPGFPAAQQQVASTVGAAPDSPVTSSSTNPTSEPNYSSLIATMPPIADDADLIEKEWVDKAKMIVESTKTDPHAQHEALTEVKADYIKKRYQKNVIQKEDGSRGNN